MPSWREGTAQTKHQPQHKNSSNPKRECLSCVYLTNSKIRSTTHTYIHSSLPQSKYHRREMTESSGNTLSSSREAFPTPTPRTELWLKLQNDKKYLLRYTTKPKTTPHQYHINGTTILVWSRPNSRRDLSSSSRERTRARSIFHLPSRSNSAPLPELTK